MNARQRRVADLLPHRARVAEHPPATHGEPAEAIDCRRAPLTLGRSRSCDVVLDAADVREFHATLEAADGGHFLRDEAQGNTTLVNGRPVRRARLRDGDRVQVGTYLFFYRNSFLVWVKPPAPVTLVADRLGQEVAGTTLLSGVSLVVRPGELVGLLGASGAGKSTLLDALCGRRPAGAGQVYLNGEPLYADFARYRHLIGHVPQEDAVHAELTARQALRYAGRLRLPAGTAAADLDRRVEETLALLGLSDRADVRIGRLSGGQRKRVSVGVEIVGRPPVLFLDEPTAGLDPGAAARLTETLRRLARQGRAVVCATHDMADAGRFDKLAVLAAGGRLAFFGPPGKARAYFGVRRLADVYGRLEEEPAADWRSQFADSAAGRRLRAAVVTGRTARPFHRQGVPAADGPQGGRTATLTGRFVRTMRADRRLLGQAVAQPVGLAGLACLAFDALPSVFFLVVLAALWLGCGLASQQLVKERAIYRRERMAGLGIRPYVLSKFLPLAGVGVLQCGLMLGVVAACKEGVAGWGAVSAAVVLASWAGVALGLLISALAPSSERATAAVPAVMLPQVVLAGVLVALPDMNVVTRAAAQLSAAKWANQAVEVGLLRGRRADAALLAQVEYAGPLWNLYPSYDLRASEGRTRFLQEHGGKAVGHEWLLALDVAVLGLFIAAPLWGTAAALRQQDPL